MKIDGYKDNYSADLNITTGKILYQGVKVGNQVINANNEKEIKTRVTSGEIRIDYKYKWKFENLRNVYKTKPINRLYIFLK